MTVEIELLILAVIYAAAGVAIIRAVMLRREALKAWREAIHGQFDQHQHRFATELDLDRARLPPEAARKLMESRRVLLAAFSALAVAMALNVFVLRPR